MGLIKGILIYKYARRRANKKRDRQDAHEDACEQEMLDGSWSDEICEYCGRTNEEHLDDTEPCS